MATKAHMSVRNMVKPGKDVSSTALNKINSKYTLCPGCKGAGEVVDESKVEIFPTVSTIRVEGNELLEAAKEAGTLNGAFINKILEIEYYNLKSCDNCQGLGVVKKSRTKKCKTKKLAY